VLHPCHDDAAETVVELEPVVTNGDTGSGLAVDSAFDTDDTLTGTGTGSAVEYTFNTDDACTGTGSVVDSAFNTDDA
jgi:hypothetical protein